MDTEGKPMRRVTTAEFYKRVGPLNVHASIVGGFPYTSVWKMLDGSQRVVGKSVDRREGGRIATDYFLTD